MTAEELDALNDEIFEKEIIEAKELELKFNEKKFYLKSVPDNFNENHKIMWDAEAESYYITANNPSRQFLIFWHGKFKTRYLREIDEYENLCKEHQARMYSKFLCLRTY